MIGSHKIGVTEILGLLAATMFVAYVAWRIQHRRAELRRTAEILTETDLDFIGDLEKFVVRRRLRPVE
ncbi:MAG: hypothetical protein NTV79_02460 [Candidatus Aureabacteria bacterium]|nr:hypothetical protein [Candidatus Auribacterota bacterium]